jgi:crotonobetainyl-CoA:carnitine CoA-transferase CaiB-like acyl-CoA transferase
LTAADIPCGAITDILTAFQSPEAKARSMLVEVEHPGLGVLRQVGIPIEFGSTPGAVRTAPPLLGEHSDQILAALGMGPDEITRLRAEDVI